MSIPIDPRLGIRFSAEVERPVPGFEDDPSSLIPVSTLGNVTSSVNDLMRATWDYAFAHTNDDRFYELRRLEALQVVTRRDVELVVVSIERGSLVLVLDWATIFALGQSVLVGVAPNAIWDLTKYSFQSLYRVINRTNEDKPQADSLTNDLLPNFVEIARSAYTALPSGVSVRTNLVYKEPQREISITIDRQAQRAILEANQVETELATRLVGSIVGLDFSENIVGVRWEHFPEQTSWCDIGGFDFNELSRFLPRDPREPPRRLGFDVEVGWRRGAVHTFPPDTIRIIRIVPEEDLLKPHYLGHPGLVRPLISDMEPRLTEEEAKFLKWFDWADKTWSDPNIAGVIGYLRKRRDILGREMSPEEIEHLIQDLLQRGILLRTRESRKRPPSHQIIRLNRSHPAAVRCIGATT